MFEIEWSEHFFSYMQLALLVSILARYITTNLGVLKKYNIIVHYISGIINCLSQCSIWSSNFKCTFNSRGIWNLLQKNLQSLFIG